MQNVKKWRVTFVIFFAVMLAACGGGGGSNGAATPGAGSSVNNLPIANAGVDQNIVTGAFVTLDGSASSDADGDSLSYLWSISSKPGGSSASLSDNAAAMPQFTPDVDGAYTFGLIVNDGQADSDVDAVSITSSTANSAPVANAGVDQNIATGAFVTLDGSASSDADGDSLSYLWSISSKPGGSSASLSDNAAAMPQFTPDVDGQYIVQLIVSDGAENSAPDTVVVASETLNSAPVANAGVNQDAIVGNTVALDGSGSSDADGNALGYSWSFVSKPSGSSAALSDSTAVAPSFLADLAGSYVVQLVVNDGLEDSLADTASITVTPPRVRLYENRGFTSADYREVSFPYSAQTTANASISGSNTYTLGEFRIYAEGASFTVTSLQAQDRNGYVVPRFVGLANGVTISEGTGIYFELETPKTGNRQADILFTFTIQETGEAFNGRYLVKTN